MEEEEVLDRSIIKGGGDEEENEEEVEEKAWVPNKGLKRVKLRKRRNLESIMKNNIQVEQRKYEDFEYWMLYHEDDYQVHSETIINSSYIINSSVNFITNFNRNNLYNIM